MSVEFNEYDNLQQTAASRQSRGGFSLISLVKKAGLAKTDEGANKVLIGVAVTCVVVAIAAPFVFGPRAASPGTLQPIGPMPAQTR